MTAVFWTSKAVTISDTDVVSLSVMLYVLVNVEERTLLPLPSIS